MGFSGMAATVDQGGELPEGNAQLFAGADPGCGPGLRNG
jgi:hypothetical protein